MVHGGGQTEVGPPPLHWGKSTTRIDQTHAES